MQEIQIPCCVCETILCEVCGGRGSTGPIKIYPANLTLSQFLDEPDPNACARCEGRGWYIRTELRHAVLID